jgi:hypothetical protein
MTLTFEGMKLKKNVERENAFGDQVHSYVDLSDQLKHPHRRTRVPLGARIHVSIFLCCSALYKYKIMLSLPNALKDSHFLN